MSRMAGTFMDGMTRAGRGIYDRLSRTPPSAIFPAMGGGIQRQSALVTNAFDVRDRMLEGSIYATGRGSYQTSILHALGKPCDDAPPIINYYNPVPAIVGCYANALGGRLGEELEVETPDGEPLQDVVSDAIGRLWKWSGLDTSLETFTTLLANQGSAGIKIVSVGGDSPRVYLRYVHPRDIDDAIEDDRGNLTGVRLKYAGLSESPLGEQPTVTEVIETLDKERFSIMVDGVEQLEGDAGVNELGVCPFVLARHTRRHGDFYGRHAYEGSENAIHSYNWALSQLDEATARAINETVFMAGAGDKPSEVQLGRLTAMYVKLTAGIPAPELKYIVPQLAIGEVRDTIVQNIELLYTRQPELILNALKLLSGTSGETLLQVLRPVEAAVLRARRLYEDAKVRSIQIGLSAGIMLGLWNLGTGTGTREAAERAYDDGQGPEAFRFADRPALPETPQVRLINAQAAVAEQKEKFNLAAAAQKIVNDPKELLTLAGYDEAEATRLASIKPAPDPNAPQNGNGGVSPRVQRLMANFS